MNLLAGGTHEATCARCPRRRCRVLRDMEGRDIHVSHMEGRDIHMSHMEGRDIHVSHMEGRDIHLSHMEGRDIHLSHSEMTISIPAAKLERAEEGAVRHPRLNIVGNEVGMGVVTWVIGVCGHEDYYCS